MTCVMCFPILAMNNDDNASVSSSDESLELEFPPPPTAFSTSLVKPVIHRSDSGKRKFYSSNHHQNLIGFCNCMSYLCFKNFLITKLTILIFSHRRPLMVR